MSSGIGVGIRIRIEGLGRCQSAQLSLISRFGVGIRTGTQQLRRCQDPQWNISPLCCSGNGPSSAGVFNNYAIQLDHNYGSVVIMGVLEFQFFQALPTRPHPLHRKLPRDGFVPIQSLWKRLAPPEGQVLIRRDKE